MQEEILAVIRGDEIDIDAFYDSLSPEVQNHSESVARLAEKLLGWALDKNLMGYKGCPLPEEVGKAARYHDIGLVLIPERILQKREDLTSAEFRVVQQHAAYGGTLLDNRRKKLAADPAENRFWAIAAEVALGHHERWDGKGYPYSQLATGVPAFVRAVAIVDAYDSMVRGSAYRMPLPPEYVLLEIIHHSGRQFDPFLMEVFKEHFDSIV